ncbi:MAG TPA: LptA/OstA family protein [Xanthobacteraceae bacterium]|nr:LptA/OstA family protein [Xanthobacteraceae bacterium]
MISTPHMCIRLFLAVLAVVFAAFGAAAQSTVSNALQGFTQNNDRPVQIKAQSFEIRDKQHTAVFSGSVHVVQGDTQIRCRSLIVTYDPQGTSGSAPAAAPGPGGRSQISRLEALGGVTVTQKDQVASGDTGIYDLRAKTIMLVGNVVVSQGQQVMRGERLVVDLNTGVSRVESGKSRGAVEMLIPQQNNTKPGAPAREMPRLDPLRPAQPN